MGSRVETRNKQKVSNERLKEEQYEKDRLKCGYKKILINKHHKAKKWEKRWTNTPNSPVKVFKWVQVEDKEQENLFSNDKINDANIGKPVCMLKEDDENDRAIAMAMNL